MTISQEVDREYAGEASGPKGFWIVEKDPKTFSIIRQRFQMICHLLFILVIDHRNMDLVKRGLAASIFIERKMNM